MADYQIPPTNIAAMTVPVSPVAQTNPLASLGQGLVQGGTLGLQAGALGIQQKQLQIQQQQALMQAKVQQAQILKEALGTAHDTFAELSKINPDIAMDFYHNKVAPLQDQFMGQYGIRMNSSEIPPSHNNADAAQEINSLVQMGVDDPSKIPIVAAGLQHLQSRMDLGQMVQDKIAGAQKTIGTIQDYNQNQEKMEKDSRDLYDKVVSNRSGGLGLQDAKVNAAIHLGTIFNQYYDPQTGDYKVPKSQYGELSIGLANLISPNSQPTEQMMKDIQQRSLKGDLAGAIGYITGTTPTGTTQAILNNLADSVDRQARTAQALRDTYLNQFSSAMPVDLEDKRKQRVISAGRGARYEDFPIQGKNSQQDLPPGTTKIYQGKTYQYQGGGKNNPQNWKVIQ